MLFHNRDSFGMSWLKITMEKLSKSFNNVFFTLLLGLLLSNHVNAESLILFDIKAQRADKALILFAQQTNKSILFSFELTKSHQTSQISGYYSFNQGITKLLRNSGLSAQFNDKNEISIVAEKQANYVDPSPKKVVAKKQVPGGLTKKLSIEKIAIIGSKVIGRTVEDLPVPVDILSNNMLKNTGQVEVARMLQTLAPSFNFSSSAISDGTDVLKPATLRGLGPDQTLILVNGKRRHQASLIHINNSVGRGTAGSDLNTIPVEAIERIEILRDGAAAQYGSDAIAGVINIVLKDDNSQGAIDSSYGQYSQGDGTTYNIGINKGFSLNDRGFFNATINFQDHQATDRSGLHGACQFSNCQLLENGNYLIGDDRELLANRNTFKIGDAAYQQLAMSYNANYSLLNGELYSFSTYSQRENDSAAFFRHNGNQLANPKLLDDDAVIPAGYLPYIHSKINDVSFNLGFKTSLENNLFIDVSYTYGKNTIDYTTKNSINASYANKLNFSEGISAAEIRNNIPRSAKAYGLALSLQTFNIDIQADFEQFSFAAGVEFRRDSYQVNDGEKYAYFDFDSSNDHNDYPTNALGGIQGFPGIAPDSAVNKKRYVSSIFAELETEIMDNVMLSSAVRYDHYDDFGDTSNVKLAANWQYNASVTFRTALSTGFRAPSMQQLYFNNTSTQFIVDNQGALNAEQIGTFRNDSGLAQAIGIPTLKEEQSTNLSLGSVIQLDHNILFSIDYYAIDINDRIVISNKLSAEHSPIIAQALLKAGTDKAQVFLNGADTKTRGVDLIASWQAPLLTGELNLTFAANFTDTTVSKLYTPHNSALNQVPVDKVFSPQDISIIETWQPKNRLSLTSNYLKNNWKIIVALNRYGQYTITDGDKQTFGAEVLTDIKVEQKINSAMSWYLGANNLFNVTPDENKIGNSHAGTLVDEQGRVIVSSPGVFKYSRRSAPFGFNGSYLYAGFNYRF